jgi:hypothetical protein
VVATPVDLAQLITVSKPIIRARYDFEEASEPGLGFVVDRWLGRIRAPRRTTTSHNVCGCLSSVGKPCLIASRDNPLLFLPCGLAVTLLHRVEGAEATAVARWRGGWR